MSLVLRLYDPDAGQVFMDGKDMKRFVFDTGSFLGRSRPLQPQSQVVA